MPDRSVHVRMAKNDDGPEVARLMEAIGAFDGLGIDWNDLEPNWLICEHSGRVVGCIQVVPARPIGRIECLAIDPEFGLMMRHAITKALVESAISAVYMFGAQAVSSLIPENLPGYLETALEREWFVVDEGSIVMRRLR